MALAIRRPSGQGEAERECRRSDHNMLMLGSPGAGKSMLARRLTTILPAMTLAEAIEITRIRRVADLTGDRTALVTTRPFRAPHYTISDVGPIGGGQVPLPGDVSLVHHGLLFLDELPEFRRHVLEVLRQPLEESITKIQPPVRRRSRVAGGDRRAARDTNQIAGIIVVPDKDALA
jgi:predicted ATPase with chaperone activity